MSKAIKRIGRKISKKSDEGYEVVFDILLGMRTNVSKAENRPLPAKAQLSEFRERSKDKYPSSGSSTTPAHSNKDFTFLDFAPLVFRRIRKLFGIAPGDYLMSLTAEYTLSEIISPGKSKSFFYFSYDMKYMLKTVYPYEAEFFKKILPHYYEHLYKNRNTLLTRFLGFHGLQMAKGKTMYFVVMNNVFKDNLDIGLKYDLKGSLHGRTSFPVKKKKDKEKEAQSF